MGSNDFSTSPLSMISVKELAMLGPTITIPQQFVRLNQEPPSLSFTSTAPNLSSAAPTIDMARLVSGDDQDVLELHKLHSSCKDWGIFQLVNHGVSSSLLEKLKHEVEEFFKLPLEEKLKYEKRVGESEGYGSKAKEDGKLDWVDSFNMLTNPVCRRKPHLFPNLPSSLRNTLESYISELQKLGTKLIGFIAKALKIDEKEMIEFIDDGRQAMRMAYYPPCPKPELVIGLSPHSDPTFITILYQLSGVDGLHIKKDGLWLPVNFNPNAFVVNVGDILEMVSNGVYHSVLHKVSANAEKERMSMVFSMNPKFETEIGPSPSLINPNNPPVFRKVLTEQFFQNFFSGVHNGKTYLEHFRIQQDTSMLT